MLNLLSAKTKTLNKKPVMNRKKLFAVSFVSLIAVGAVISPVVFADKYQEQINQLNSDSANKQGSVNQLGAQASDLKDKISKLQAQIVALQGQITNTEQQRDKTQAAIVQAEADLVKQRSYLSDSVKAAYVDGGVSSLEMLASSENINQFVDQQQYQNSVQGQVQRTLDSIKQLQAKLAKDKATLEQMISDLNKMRADVSAQQAEQGRLLSLNEQEQSDLNGQIASNKTKVKDLEKQQALENARLSAGTGIPAGARGGGGYPAVWANAPIDSMIDSWGMYNRECVSYTAFKVAESGRYMPYWGGIGNANQWDDNARRAGIPVDSSPRPGDVAVSNAGYYGHVMYVESVASDGSIYVSDYNQQFDGLYRAYWISASTVAAKNLVFIHF